MEKMILLSYPELYMWSIKNNRTTEVFVSWYSCDAERNR